MVGYKMKPQYNPKKTSIKNFVEAYEYGKSETLKQVFEIIDKEEILAEDDLTFKYLILQKLKELETK